MCVLPPAQVESYFYDIRKQLFEYDQVLNTQRDKVYAERRRALEASDLTPLMVEYAEKTIDDILEVLSSWISQAYSSGRLWLGGWAAAGAAAQYGVQAADLLSPPCSPTPTPRSGPWRCWCLIY